MLLIFPLPPGWPALAQGSMSFTLALASEESALPARERSGL
jgi:hypothetical protein